MPDAFGQHNWATFDVTMFEAVEVEHDPRYTREGAFPASPDYASIAERLDRGHLDATTLMERLIQRGVPQRTAHGIVQKLVRKALDRNARLSDLSLGEFRDVYPDLDESVYNVLGVEQAVGAMQSYGSTARERVEEQIRLWKERLG